MENDRIQPDMEQAGRLLDAETDESRPTRRGFLTDVGRKARYAAPIILTLTAASQRVCASEAGPAPSCTPSGSACAVDADCCSNRCDNPGTGNCLPPL